MPTDCLANDCWSHWTLFEWIAMPNDWVAGCALSLDGSASRFNLWLRTLFECLVVLLSASLDAHIVWMFGGAIQVSCWLHTSLEGMTADYREAGCVHCLNGWQWQLLRGWLWTLLESMAITAKWLAMPTSRRAVCPNWTHKKMSVPDFERKLHEPVYAAWSHCGLN